VLMRTLTRPLAVRVSMSTIAALERLESDNYIYLLFILQLITNIILSA